MWLPRSPLARAPYVVCFDLKLLIEHGNLQVYIYRVRARKRAPGTSKTHFWACKISKFPRGMPPDPPHTFHFGGPHFLYLPWASPILSAALHIGVLLTYPSLLCGDVSRRPWDMLIHVTYLPFHLMASCYIQSESPLTKLPYTCCKPSVIHFNTHKWNLHLLVELKAGEFSCIVLVL